MLYCHSPVASSFRSTGATPFWIVFKGAPRDTSCTLVKNALNFSFSAPPHRFVVLPAGPCIFKAAAANSSVAGLIVTARQCTLGDLRLPLFPSRQSTLDFLAAGEPAQGGDPPRIQTRATGFGEMRPRNDLLVLVAQSMLRPRC